ncbi:MAG: hypothetical protein AABY64_09130 [Bdellovibrionota bacterium]
MKNRLIITFGVAVLLPHLVLSENQCKSVFAVQTQNKSQNETFRSEPKNKTRGSIYIHEKTEAVEEHSLRVKNVASHIYMDSLIQPYFFFAFPEGNSGIGLWFKSPSGKAFLQATSKAQVIQGSQGLHGAEIEMKSGVKTLNVEDSALGSMRFIRDRELGLKIPEEVQTSDVQISDGALIIRRTSLNGLAEYYLKVIPAVDTKIVETASGIEFRSSTEVRFKVQALNSEKLLTAVSPRDIFKAEVLAKMSPEKLQAFSFLLYKEKLMAGSPRYLTKFGRDSIFTLSVLMNAMKPEAIENLLDATMSSMNSKTGAISHEQHEGDFASFVRLKEGKKVKGVNKPIEDYKMIDDDFAFVLALGKYAKLYPERMNAFLNAKDQRGIPHHKLTEKLFANIDKSTAAFRDNPVFSNLIKLHRDEKTGQWRDSENGLGGGIYPFDVNAAFVPAALKALTELYSQPKSQLYDLQKAESLKHSYEVWNTHAAPLFEVRISAAQARSMGETYLQSLNIDPVRLSEAPKEDLAFPAISLDKKGRPIRIMHSDDSIMMTFGSPSLDYLRTVSQRIDNLFPYGLKTPVGILVANPAFTSTDMQKKFDETKYHGRVSWAMQEDLLVYGINRQLGRSDIPADLRTALIHSKTEVEKVIQSKSKMAGTEVFSIFYLDNNWVAIPFRGDAKSNSNQLWSHLRIASPQPQP